ncbi:hypothetical protein ColLi_05300 [Colletotrichum liriopes]|uniref:Uncharacterized protein n=1 Tax=Colletotrichum liriopes TaxID=708192 RepID=A0AA37GKL0_9PEZI|nr:hypothetical protein ColLi_05300 [Colletotrichum liriopes]
MPYGPASTGLPYQLPPQLDQVLNDPDMLRNIHQAFDAYCAKDWARIAAGNEPDEDAEIRFGAGH